MWVPPGSQPPKPKPKSTDNVPNGLKFAGLLFAVIFIAVYVYTRGDGWSAFVLAFLPAGFWLLFWGLAKIAYTPPRGRRPRR
jgi:hypothetical protein